MKDLLCENRLRISSRGKDVRNEIESDYGRIIFSPAIRRMHDKTQVFPLTLDDNIHSRLTHSNEVMTLGHTLGLMVANDKILLKEMGILSLNSDEAFRKIPTLMQNICLVHDIGNPPFGHFAETVIQDYFRKLENGGIGSDQGKINFNLLTTEQRNDFLYFDGNAQGFRVLTKLQTLGDAFGLNLTYATLASSIKYPNTNKPVKRSENGFRLENKKLGIFNSEKVYFNKIIDYLNLRTNQDQITRHPFCYLMEAADSIAYITMDIEDGYNKGLLSLQYIYDVLHQKYCNISTQNPTIKNLLDLLDSKNKNIDAYKIVNFRIILINYLINLAFNNFKRNINLIISGTYNMELIDDDENEIAKCLGDITKKKIFTAREINSLEITGKSVITGLLDFYIDFLFNENAAMVRRAEALISSSIKTCVMEENILEHFKYKVKNDDYNPFFYEKVNKFEFLSKIESERRLTGIEKGELLELKEELKRKYGFQIRDLSPYYKFKVILDFITGMTDQYALSHFQMISGQKIGS